MFSSKVSPFASRGGPPGSLVRVGIGLIIAALMPLFSVALASGAPAGALEVDQAVLRVTAAPGETVTVSLQVSSADPANIILRVVGVAQGRDGAFIPIDPLQEANPYSAVSYVSLNPSEFRLEPGGAQSVDVTVTAPEDVGSGTRYAMIYISTTESGSGSQGVGTQEAIGVNLLLFIEGGEQVNAGSIDSVDVEPVTQNHPIRVSSSFTNTGNTHYRLGSRVRLSDASGYDFATARTQLSIESLMPSYSRDFHLELVPGETLPAGEYFIDFDIFDTDMQTIETQRAHFHLSEEVSFRNPDGSDDGASSSLESTGSAGGMSSVGWMILFGLIAGTLLVGLGFGLFPRRRQR